MVAAYEGDGRHRARTTTAHRRRSRNGGGLQQTGSKHMTHEQQLRARIAQLEDQLRANGIVPASPPNAGPSQEEADALAAIVAHRYSQLALKDERDRRG